MDRKKLIIILSIFLLTLLLAAALTGGLIFFRASRYAEAVFAEKTPISPQTLGKRFVLQIDCFVPWGQSLTETYFTPGTGFVQSGDISATRLRTRLDGEEKLISIPLTAYRTGKLEPGKLSAVLERPFFRNGPARKHTLHSFQAIAIQPRPITANAELPLADEVKPPESKINRKHIIFPVIFLLLAAAAIFILLKSLYKKAPRQQSYREQALDELESLRQQVSSCQLPLAAGMARLSDIVRVYLSRRFQWRTTQQTSQEFFTTLKQQQLLTAQQREYLTEFITSADLIKFANIKPASDDFSDACSKAEKLICETADDSTDGRNSTMEVK